MITKRDNLWFILWLHSDQQTTHRASSQLQLPLSVALPPPA